MFRAFLRFPILNRSLQPDLNATGLGTSNTSCFCPQAADTLRARAEEASQLASHLQEFSMLQGSDFDRLPKVRQACSSMPCPLALLRDLPREPLPALYFDYLTALDRQHRVM